MYDWLTPEAYRESLRRCVDHAGEGRRWLDAGCGSGLLIECLNNRLAGGIEYVGLDILRSGLDAARARAHSLQVTESVRIVQADLAKGVPLDPRSIDVVVAHFSIYTLKNSSVRKQVLDEIRRVLRPDGCLIVVNPSSDYDPIEIIRESIQLDKQNHGVATAFAKKWFLYPFTLRFGLRFIKRQLDRKHWHAYIPEEAIRELEESGFKVERTETVYGNSANLIVARPKENNDGITNEHG